jgi:two-component system, chemotaxis family, CheB/CheR fusion protein
LFEDVTGRGISDSKGRLQGRTTARAERKRESSRVKQELADAQDALRAVIESEDALKEEFQSANEEILSANEELQSTNEELETAKEELQSSNEELTTVNEELQTRNLELLQANNDLSNLLTNVHIPVLILDTELRIRRLTPAAEKLLNLIASDIGRSITHLNLNMQVNDLEKTILEVIDQLGAKELEVQDMRGRWYSMRIRPYKTLENKIEGAVVSFIDIDPLMRHIESLKGYPRYCQAIIETVHEPLLILGSDLLVRKANHAFYAKFGAAPIDTEQRLIYDIGNGSWATPELRALLEDVIPKNKEISNFQIEYKHSADGTRRVRLNARQLEEPEGGEVLILLAMEEHPS